LSLLLLLLLLFKFNDSFFCRCLALRAALNRRTQHHCFSSPPATNHPLHSKLNANITYTLLCIRLTRAHNNNNNNKQPTQFSEPIQSKPVRCGYCQEKIRESMLFCLDCELCAHQACALAVRSACPGEVLAPAGGRRRLDSAVRRAGRSQSSNSRVGSSQSPSDGVASTSTEVHFFFFFFVLLLLFGICVDVCSLRRRISPHRQSRLSSRAPPASATSRTARRASPRSTLPRATSAPCAASTPPICG
jgi:hypothetical protein